MSAPERQQRVRSNASRPHARSPTSGPVRDLPLTYAHSRFQGEGAAQEIVAALTESLVECAAADDMREAIVIIRGGGAVNALAWLNDYDLARFICDQRTRFAHFDLLGQRRAATIPASSRRNSVEFKVMSCPFGNSTIPPSSALMVATICGLPLRITAK